MLPERDSEVSRSEVAPFCDVSAGAEGGFSVGFVLSGTAGGVGIAVTCGFVAFGKNLMTMPAVNPMKSSEAATTGIQTGNRDSGGTAGR